MDAPTHLMVDLDELRQHLAYRARINATPLTSITWMQDGKPVLVTADQIRWWAFTGLNHLDFGRALAEDAEELKRGPYL